MVDRTKGLAFNQGIAVKGAAASRQHQIIVQSAYADYDQCNEYTHNWPPPSKGANASSEPLIGSHRTEFATRPLWSTQNRLSL